ncbi:COPPER-BINDING PERIPLASMIC PROTEIN [Salix koriyanagi]|uniref:COPPER-BINDING PERIPLASMIC PROTEIN n=1 Tax=Salix koriyanagi TaxID=2511006 RepID=A0A9Q0X2Q0_9ROSI|nr:COPPER-BINDING PERIPLASMIC PROTEIN [Salix koriyanagi]
MAIDVCSEISSAGISPRISFSHDLNQPTDAVSIEDHHHHRRLDSSLLDPDFDFCIGNSNNHQPTSLTSQPRHQTTTETTEKKRLKEFLSASPDADEKPASKSFWLFKRSNSLNCDSTRSKGLIRSLHFLSRSNSTGSAPNPPKQTMSSKETQEPKLHKQASVPSRKPSVPSSAPLYPYNTQQKPPLLRKCGSYGNGVRMSPVLNITPPYISRGAVNTFGLGSLFCNGKVKRKKG